MRCRIPGCDARVCDIKRHLRTHLKRQEINEEDIDSHAEIMRHGKQKSLVSSGNPSKRGKTSVRRRKKWCPMPQCTTICVRMDKHLQHDHNLKVGTVPYKVHLKEAKPYKGIMELDDHPRSVLAGEPSTSSAGPQQTEAADCEDDSSSDGATNICPPSASESDSEADGATNICPPSASESDSEADPESTSSDSGDRDPPKETNLKYFNSTTFSSARHQWLCGFFQYLGLPDAGYRKETQRLQHASQIKILLETLAADEDDLECLGAENGDAVWVRWVDPHLQNKSKAPGTLRSYLTSLQLFLTYLTGRKYHPRSMPSLSPFLKDIFGQMIPALKGWRACIDSFSQDSQLRKYIGKCDALITNDDIDNLKKSKPYLEGASIIDLAETGASITSRQFTLVRDYLLCRLTLATGTRPGALNNVLLSDYETSRVSEGNRIILVPKHKRTKDGPAMLGMDPLMQKEMATYVSHIRPAFANPGEKKLFVKDDGAGFPEGTIGKCVVAFFERSGVTSTRVGHTHIRKYIATQTHEKGNEEEGHTVEKVMSHGSTTKQRCYMRADCTRTASKAMEVIARVTGRGSPQSSKPKARSPSPSGSRPLPASAEIPVMVFGNVPLTEGQKLAISAVFAEELAKSIPVSRSQVCSRISTSSSLRHMASSSTAIKKIQNYISYKQRKNPDLPHPPSSTASATSRVGRWVSDLAETRSTTSVREAWNDEDTDAITQHLSSYMSCPPKTTLQELFQSSDQLRAIMDREGFSRCYEKSKNIMRKRKRQDP